MRIFRIFVFVKQLNKHHMKAATSFTCLLLASVALLSSCGNSGKKEQASGPNELLAVHYGDLSKEEKDLPLSTFVEDVQVVHFENVDDAFFKAWNIAITDHYIGVRQSGAPFKLFDRSGKYLCDVGAVGNGPGEYAISIYDEIIDEKGGRIFLMPFAGSSILVYDLNGKYVKDIPLPVKNKAIKPKMNLNADGTLSVVHMPFSTDDPIAFCIDTAGNLLKEIPTPEHMIVNSAEGEIFSNRNTQGEFEFFHTSNDTIFLYDATANRLVPNFTITFPDPDNKPIHIYRSTPQGIFANCYFWDEEKQRPGEGNTYFIDRKTGKSTLFHVVNDFYGNLSAGTNFNQGYWYLNMQPENLKELIEEHLASGNCPEAARQKLKDLAATLHENDNNVLMFGKLKQP